MKASTSSAQAPIAERARGALTGRYRLERRLSGSRSAVVHAATCLGTGRAVAIKETDCRDDPRAIDRARAEAWCLGQLRHPLVPRLLDAIEGDERYYVVMERIDHPAWMLRPAACSSWPIETVLVGALQVLDALADAHALGIVHRDVKPSNVLLEDSGDVVRAHLIDFGIALPPGVAPERDVIVGTLPYMAPEQAAARDIDHRVDLYAVGAMIHALVVGRHPFGAPADTVALLERIEQHPLPPLSQLRRDVPACLDDVIAIATAKAPQDRYPSATSMIRALREVLSDITPPRAAPAESGVYPALDCDAVSRRTPARARRRSTRFPVTGR